MYFIRVQRSKYKKKFNKKYNNNNNNNNIKKIIIIIIIITDLYSAFRSEDTEALGAAQEDKVSLNRWVFK